MVALTPREIVDELDKYIIGQEDAKKAVAIALRNRYRRSRLSPEMREEVTPKNIIMSGPTGVGKTEIARRLARLVNAPFIKVEATKFTEVGYVGRDVESIVRDLLEESIRLVKKNRQESVQEKAKANAEERILDLLLADGKAAPPPSNPLQMLLGGPKAPAEPAETEEQKQARMSRREETAYRLKSGQLDETVVEIEVEDSGGIGIEIAGVGTEINMGEMFSGILPKRPNPARFPSGRRERFWRPKRRINSSIWMKSSRPRWSGQSRTASSLSMRSIKLPAKLWVPARIFPERAYSATFCPL